MKTYNVKITETLEREIDVEAESKKQAKEIVERMYSNEELILDYNDFQDYNIKANEVKMEMER